MDFHQISGNVFSHLDLILIGISIGIGSQSFNIDRLIIPQNCRYRHILPAFQYQNNIHQADKNKKT